MTEFARSRPADPLRPPSLLDACIPVAALIVLLATSYLLYGEKAAQGPNQVALIFAALIAAGVGVKNGMPWSGYARPRRWGRRRAFRHFHPSGGWRADRHLGAERHHVAMVYYGLELLSPDYFYASSSADLRGGRAAALAVPGRSLARSASALMGFADNMNLSPAITAGAVISGAYFGDKISPLSDTVNLATAAAGANLFAAHSRDPVDRRTSVRCRLDRLCLAW